MYLKCYCCMFGGMEQFRSSWGATWAVWYTFRIWLQNEDSQEQGAVVRYSEPADPLIPQLMVYQHVNPWRLPIVPVCARPIYRRYSGHGHSWEYSYYGAFRWHQAMFRWHYSTIIIESPALFLSQLPTPMMFVAGSRISIAATVCAGEI